MLRQVDCLASWVQLALFFEHTAATHLIRAGDYMSRCSYQWSQSVCAFAASAISADGSFEQHTCGLPLIFKKPANFQSVLLIIQMWPQRFQKMNPAFVKQWNLANFRGGELIFHLFQQGYQGGGACEVGYTSKCGCFIALWKVTSPVPHFHAFPTIWLMLQGLLFHAEGTMFWQFSTRRFNLDRL